jgi:hypothetical protein
LWQVVSRDLVLKCDEDSAGGKDESNDFNETLDTRAEKAVDHAVAEIRGAIESAGRYPLSVTAGGVPPEAFNHALVMAAWRLCAIKPSLLAVLLADGGEASPMKSLYREAQEWLKMARAGGSLVLPADPTGEDYSTAVSASNPAISGIRWGDSLADDAEYEAGETASGVAVSNLSNNMNTQ